MSKIKILSSDSLAPEGIKILEDSGLFEVDARKSTERSELLKIIKNYEGLIIRSASEVDEELLEKASKLKVVIRAGVGVDNIDILACSSKGIVVMNAPGGNSVSTAEHAIALMFASARMIPQANQSMHEKKWEKSKFKGSQLTGKTLGVVGLGRIGKEVVKRGKGLQMNVLGYDPFIPKENLEHLQIKIVDVPEILAKSDFITVHTPLTDVTKNLVNKDNISKLKKGVRLINAARGGIYNEDALALGLETRQIGGVGLDVYSQEPPAASFSLLAHDNAILTPHLGASTNEAQIEVARETAQEMVDYFKDGVANNSLNFPTLDPKEMDVLAPWFELCERAGSFAAQVVNDPIESVEMEFKGEIIDLNLSPLKIAMSKGILSVAFGDDVNLVNAPMLAKDRGINIFLDELKEKSDSSIARLIFKSKTETLQLRTTVNFSGGTVISLNNMALEFIPTGHILYVINKDVPKVVGELGTILGELNLNIASLQLSREEKGGRATTVIQIDGKVPDNVISKLKEKEYILDAKYVKVLL